MKKTKKVEKKSINKNINIILIAILTISSIVLIYIIQQNKIYQAENNKLLQLRREYTELEKENEIYVTLKNNYLDILEEENNLGTNNKNINEQINNLNKDITALKQQIDETNKKIKAIS